MSDYTGQETFEKYTDQNPPVDNTKEQIDPFSSDQAPGVSLIVLMRIYDLLAGIYSSMEPQKAAAVIELHSQGQLFLTLPYLDIHDNTNND